MAVQRRILTAARDAVRRVALTAKHAERSTGRTTRRPEQPTRPIDEGVRIEYSPQADGDPDPGEVVWTWVPFEEDRTLGKDRPVVIVGRHGDSLCGVALTSKGGHPGERVGVGTGAWDAKGRPSYAKIDRLLDINPGEVRREGATLDRARFDTLVAAVDARHDIVRPESSR